MSFLPFPQRFLRIYNELAGSLECDAVQPERSMVPARRERSHSTPRKAPDSIATKISEVPI